MANPEQEQERLRENIERTRAELGQTVEALAHKADVKAQAQAKAQELQRRLPEPLRDKPVLRVAAGVGVAWWRCGSSGGASRVEGRSLKRTFTEFQDDNLTDWAAALTYYGVLSIFPALIVLVSVLGLIGSSATDPLLDNLGTVAPGPAKDILTDAIENLQGSSGASGVVFIAALGAAVWSASGYISAFMRARTLVYDIEGGGRSGGPFPYGSGLTVLLMA